MSYTFQVEVPPNTPETDKLDQTIRFPPCVVDLIYLVIPRGHAFLTETWFDYQSNKILPSNPEYNYKGNGVEIPIRPNLAIIEDPYELTINVFNLDDTYNHTVYAYCNITIVDEEQAMIMSRLVNLLNRPILHARIKNIMTQLIAGVASDNKPYPLLVDSSGRPIVVSDRTRKITSTRLISQAAYTSNQDTGFLTNPGAIGALFFLYITAVPGVDTIQPIVVMQNQGEDVGSNILVGDTKATTGVVKLLVYPGAVVGNGTMDKIAGFPLPETYKLTIVHSGAGSFTYLADVEYFYDLP